MAGERHIWLCILISCVMIAWMVLAWVFLPLYFVTVRKLSASAMSVLMSVLGLSAAVCSILVPWLSDRFGRKPIMIGFCFLPATLPALVRRCTLIASVLAMFMTETAPAKCGVVVLLPNDQNLRPHAD